MLRPWIIPIFVFFVIQSLLGAAAAASAAAAAAEGFFNYYMVKGVSSYPRRNLFLEKGENVKMRRRKRTLKRYILSVFDYPGN